jgi:hypothetical protein
MVRTRFYSVVSNHEARGPSFETREERAPQDEVGDCSSPSQDEVELDADMIRTSETLY